jgi:hypothetical protein
MKRGAKTETGLRLAVRVLCALRGWNLRDLACVITRQTATATSAAAVLRRIRRPAPTAETYAVLAAAFGLPVPGLIKIVLSEADRARKQGRPVDPPRIHRDTVELLA